jgi:hypothetical protein
VTATLERFLPASVVDRLRAAADSKAALDTFDGEAETPALVWNGAMRKTLRRFVASQLDAYRKSGEPDGHLWALTHDVKVRRRGEGDTEAQGAPGGRKRCALGTGRREKGGCCGHGVGRTP